MINFKCAHCQRAIRVADAHAGRKARCPGCSQVVQVPSAGDAAPPLPPPASPAPRSRESAAERPVRPARPAPPAPPTRPLSEDDDPDRDEEVPEEVADEIDEDEEDDDRPRRKGRKRGRERKRRGRSRSRRRRAGDWAPCPECGSTDATQQHFTWWGSWIGPLMINTVRCDDCGTTYNGIHGDSNGGRIALFMGAQVVILILLILGACTGVMTGLLEPFD